MRRSGLILVAAAVAAVLLTTNGMSAPPTSSPLDNPVKLDVLGVWAHPDDDTSIIGPCGVWHREFGIRCGIAMVTRGEGGGNAVGTEIGPALGLRRENEDRAAHYRSGTVDIFNLDRVDFFFNQSAPETNFFWGHDETLRRLVRVIRMTRPAILIGFTPTLGAGHGNHQVAGRLVWEAAAAAADPAMFPEQLTGPHALSTWQVKKVFSGGSTAGTGGTTTAADCTIGFIPTPGTNLDTVAGTWTGYDSPFLWPPGNVQGKPAGTPKIWAQVATEGASAYPTQSRVMSKATAVPGCSRFGQTGPRSRSSRTRTPTVRRIRSPARTMRSSTAPRSRIPAASRSGRSSTSRSTASSTSRASRSPRRCTCRRPPGRRSPPGRRR